MTARLLALVIAAKAAAAASFDVRKFGAKGDKTAKGTAVIRSAVDAASWRHGEPLHGRF